MRTLVQIRKTYIYYNNTFFTHAAGQKETGHTLRKLSSHREILSVLSEVCI